MYEDAPGLDERKELPSDTKVDSDLLKSNLPTEKRKVKISRSQGDIGKASKKVNFADALEEDSKTQFLPTKILALDQKLEAPNYDTMGRIKKIQDKLSKEGLSKRLYED